ncbi:SDR family oxidoreductase [Streptomonospora salina]|uniref:NAD(P)-dependent dehydrogenase (Short-subunit alcohol dehydrogenase family) n=1 Tax=Streptomonospora salina TaxID=104205 RepID=A0A841E1D2_9ACTN|nr:SDR family oxidoreductase [Streptomonospora salina]MBB5997597.1 NAD(P)-dependent dehydrogenase (short-subunit alcohol dehydrogenase family) [Streptomonospora salina]
MSQALGTPTALVTGASKGIGRGIAERLGHDGALVAVHYGTDAAGADETVEAIRAEGGDAFAVGADLASPGGDADLAAGLAAGLDEAGADGALDVLVNNAGIGASTGLEDITPDEFDRLFTVNVRAPHFLTQRLLPTLRDGGRIVNISSGAARIAMPEMLPYAMTKGALESLTHQLAQRLGPRRITVNAVAPGIVEIDRTRRQMRENPGMEDYGKTVSALGRLGTPTDVAGVVAFLASADSGWVTGQVLDATGGSHL